MTGEQGAYTEADVDRLVSERTAQAELQAVRARIAGDYRLSPEDRDTLLTGTDEVTLAAQAVRLQQIASQRLAMGNVAPREGQVTYTYVPGERETREFVNDLFGNADF